MSTGEDITALEVAVELAGEEGIKTEALEEILRLVRRPELMSPEANALVQTALMQVSYGEAIPWRLNLPTVDIVIRGQVPSKSNCLKPTIIGGVNVPRRASIGKTKELEAYELSFAGQVPVEHRGLSMGPFIAILHVFEGSRRPDLDNAGKVVLDCLQKVTPKRDKKTNLTAVIQNDRYLRALHMFWGLDKDNPRVRIQLIPFQDELPFLQP